MDRRAAAVPHVRTAQDRLPIVCRVLLFEAFWAAVIVGAPLLTGTSGEGVDALLLLGLALVSFVVWVRWFLAVYRAVHALGRARHRLIWAVLGWLLPIVALFLPKRMANDVWWVRGRSPLPRVLQAWWVAEIALMVLVRSDRRPPRFDLGTAGLVLTLVLYVATTLLSIRVAVLLTARVADAVVTPDAPAEPVGQSVGV